LKSLRLVSQTEFQGSDKFLSHHS